MLEIASTAAAAMAKERRRKTMDRTRRLSASPAGKKSLGRSLRSWNPGDSAWTCPRIYFNCIVTGAVVPWRFVTTTVTAWIASTRFGKPSTFPCSANGTVAVNKLPDA